MIITLVPNGLRQHENVYVSQVLLCCCILVQSCKHDKTASVIFNEVFSNLYNSNWNSYSIFLSWMHVSALGFFKLYFFHNKFSIFISPTKCRQWLQQSYSYSPLLFFLLIVEYHDCAFNITRKIRELGSSACNCTCS